MAVTVEDVLDAGVDAVVGAELAAGVEDDVPPPPQPPSATAASTIAGSLGFIDGTVATAATVAPVSTPEIRIDPLTGMRAIVAGTRAQRPGGGLSATAPPELDPAEDPFAEGNEDRTPPEVYAVRPNGGPPNTPGWTVRVVPNLYPALSASVPVDELADTTAEGEPAPKPGANANRDLFWSTPAIGAHEVVINSPRSVISLGQLTVDEVAAAMDVWRERMLAHTGAAYVHMIVNERARGRSVAAPHSRAAVRA